MGNEKVEACLVEAGDGKDLVGPAKVKDLDVADSDCARGLWAVVVADRGSPWYPVKVEPMNRLEGS